MSWKAGAPVLAAALWWGSLSAIGLVAVPVLFANASSPAVAGNLAAKLFAAQTWISLACGMVLLMAARTDEDPPRMDWADGAVTFIVGGMLLAILVQFGVAPRIVARQDLRFWHALGTALYAAQWGCALAVLWRMARRRAPS
jgi:hypothetical protein